MIRDYIAYNVPVRLMCYRFICERVENASCTFHTNKDSSQITGNHRGLMEKFIVLIDLRVETINRYHQLEAKMCFKSNCVFITVYF